MKLLLPPLRGRLSAFASAMLASLLLTVAPAAFAQISFAPDLTDIYGVTSEPGWSLQVMQQGGVLVSLLFFYDAGRQPSFVVATLDRIDASTWSGDLYRTSGPYFGAGSYDPVLLSATKVGSLKFIRTSGDTATLQYAIDGVAVTKSVSRQLLRYDDYSGAYVATVYVVTTHCSNSADDGARVGSYAVNIEQKGTDMKITAGFAKRGTSTCQYSGTYTQAGRAGAFGSAYSCSDGDEGSMGFFELTKRPGMFSGWLQGHSITDSCDYSGTMTGLIPL